MPNVFEGSQKKIRGAKVRQDDIIHTENETVGDLSDDTDAGIEFRSKNCRERSLATARRTTRKERTDDKSGDGR